MPYSAAASGVRCSRRSSLARRCLDLRRHLGLGDRLLEVGQLLLVGALVAQLALDGRHLLAQQHLALAAVERGLGLVADLGRQAQHFEAMGQQLETLSRPRHEVGGLEDVLASPPAWRRDRSRRDRPACRARSSPRRSGAARAARCGSRSSDLAHLLLQVRGSAPRSPARSRSARRCAGRAPARKGWPSTNSVMRKRCTPWQIR